ncbi:MAG TPA: NAD(P)-dependent oxidoreductase [Microbacteriaceae bacterium]|nr:NAD(P)-dependent oxidoreductase [Microbacteriaceae bacterium]
MSLPHGSLSVAPFSDTLMTEAARSAGAQLEPLSERTRALVWLSPTGSAELAAVLREYPAIAWVQLPWAGVDAFSDLIASHPRVLWTSAKGAYAQPVAEHALMLILSLLRGIPERIADRRWTGRKAGRSLFGLTVCIVGAGGIARVLSDLLKPFGVQLRVVRRRPIPFTGAELVTSDVREGARGADVLILAAAHTPSSERLVDAELLTQLAPNAIVINVARGALIDTEALVAALLAGRIGGAGLDVTDPEPLPDEHALWECPNTIITPHSADTPAMTEPLLAERVRHNVAAWLGAGDFIGVVDPHAGY